MDKLIQWEFIEILNAIGLPLLAYSVFVMYRSLTKRTAFLQNSMADMKYAYDSVIETSKQRSGELEALLANQKKFNDFYLQMVSDSNEHVEKIREWRKSEIVILEGRINELSNDLEKANEMIENLRSKNLKFKTKIDTLKAKVIELTRGVGPGESMARGYK